MATEIGPVRHAISRRIAVSATVALTTMVTLENDDAVSFSERRTGLNIVYDADAFVAQVLWIVMEFKIM